VIKLRELFDDIDEDGSNRINRFEFRRYLMRVERSFPDSSLFAEAESIFSSLDSDRNGLVEFHEVRRAREPRAHHCCSASSHPLTPPVLQLLRLWYPYLTAEECKELAKLAPTRHEPPPADLEGVRTWEQADIEAMHKHFMSMDSSGDGQLDCLVRLGDGVMGWRSRV